MIEKIINYMKREIAGSYSCFGEDKIVDKLVGLKRKGFYVDIGCAHPLNGSNTYMFYKRGWQGIAIDPDTRMREKFMQARPRDHLLNLGIDIEQGIKTFYLLDQYTNSALIKPEGKHFEETQIRTMTLKAVLDSFSAGKEIDFLSVDTEGNDYKVLKSNDWDKYSPRIICIEAWNDEFKKCDEFLKSKGYVFVAKTEANFIYQKKAKA